LAGTITAIDGTIDVMIGTMACALKIEIPEELPLPVEATGALQPSTDETDRLQLVFEQVDVDITSLTLSDASSDVCELYANLGTSQYEPDLEAGLLEALQSRADTLACLDCMSGCPQAVACITQ
jgi:hypothetical protein